MGRGRHGKSLCKYEGDSMGEGDWVDPAVDSTCEPLEVLEDGAGDLKRLYEDLVHVREERGDVGVPNFNLVE